MRWKLHIISNVHHTGLILKLFSYDISCLRGKVVDDGARLAYFGKQNVDKHYHRNMHLCKFTEKSNTERRGKHVNSFD